MIDKLSRNPKSPFIGWCSASRQTIADVLSITRRSVIDIIQRLEGKGLVERQIGTDFLRTTQAWYDAVTGCAEMLQGVKKVHTSEESSHGVKKSDTRKETSQLGVKKVHTIIKDYNNSSVDNKEGGQNFSNAPPKEEKKIPPVPAPPPFKRIADYEEARRIILRNEDLQRIASKELRNTGLTQMFEDFQSIVEEFISDKRMENGEDIPWVSEKDVRSHFRNWLPIKLPVIAKNLQNAKSHQSNAGRSGSIQSGSAVANRKKPIEVDLEGALRRRMSPDRDSDSGGIVDGDVEVLG